MPNLENLKKQAKLILRWHRDRYYPVAAQIRTVLPRCKDLSDSQILDQPFRLADAQEMVARQSGFESWEALKQGFAAMPGRSALSAKPMLTAAEPQLFVSEIQRSCDYFTQKLGFSVVFVYGEPPFYGQVKRDGARLNLRCVQPHPMDIERREQESLLSAAITLETANELKQLFLEFQAAGVAFHQGLVRQPWGAKNFIVKDLDGNLLLFAGPADEVQP